MRPVDVSPTGSGSGTAPQPVTTAPRDWSQTAKDIGIGVGLGVARFARNIVAPSVGGYLRAMLGLDLADNAIKGAREDGVVGAVAGLGNTVNPLYHFGVGVVDIDQKAKAGDTRGAVADGTTLGLSVATTIIGGVLGMETSPGAAKGLVPGEAGSYEALTARAGLGDALEAHHMPQAALEFTSRGDGGALVLTRAEHMQTRTWGAKGGRSARADAGRSFRDVLASDIRDVRRIVGTKYDQGLRELLQYYRDEFPHLMK
jgi:hypothetical protein